MLFQVETPKCGIGLRHRSLYTIQNKLSLSVEAKIKVITVNYWIFTIRITTLKNLLYFVKTLVTIYIKNLSEDNKTK